MEEVENQGDMVPIEPPRAKDDVPVLQAKADRRIVAPVEPVNGKFVPRTFLGVGSE